MIVDVTDSIDRQVAALIRHESQVPGFNVPEGDTIGRARQAARPRSWRRATGSRTEPCSGGWSPGASARKTPVGLRGGGEGAEPSVRASPPSRLAVDARRRASMHAF